MLSFVCLWSPLDGVLFQNKVRKRDFSASGELFLLSLGYKLPRHVHELLLRTGNIEHAHLPLEKIMHHEDTLLSGEVFAEYHPVIAAPCTLADDARFTPVKGEERDAV